MPRSAKTRRRQKINASIEYKKGNRAEAYKLWEQAAKSTAEAREAKRNKKQKASAANEGGDS